MVFPLSLMKQETLHMNRLLKRVNKLYQMRRRRGITRGKGSIKHSRSLIGVIGPSSAPVNFVGARTGAQERSTDGTPVTILNNVSTNENCATGDIVKYVSFRIQAGVRDDGTNTNVNGWLEWAIVWIEEEDTIIPITQMGSQSLGDVATQMFRNDCLMHGTIPISDAGPQTAVQDIQIKLPNRCCKFKVGSRCKMFIFWRDVNTTLTGGDDVRTLLSSWYKSYN